MHLRLLLVVAATSVGCSPSPDSAPALRMSDVVYGEDNRQEVYQLAPDSALRAAARSVAAVIPKSYLKYDGQGRPVLRGPTLEDLLGACPGGRFSLQTSLAECTAVLVDDNLLATAGHCFKHAFDCQNYVFVFDYLYDTEGGAIAVDAEDIFECRKAQVQENDLNQVRPLRDYAIIELTARVAGRDPLVARDSAPVVGEALAVISAGNGIPLKVDTGARVLGTTSIWQDYFALDTDTFDGASGAPVLDESGAVLGLAVRGQDDYRLDDAAGCLVVNTLARPELRGDEADKLSDAAAAVGTKDPPYAEEASLLKPAVDALCARSYPSPRLCGIEPACGDRICSWMETNATCAADCHDLPRSLPPDGGPLTDTPDAGEPSVGQGKDRGTGVGATPGGTNAASGCSVSGAESGASGSFWSLLLLGWCVRAALARMRAASAGKRRPSAMGHGPR